MPIALPSQITKTLICSYLELENMSDVTPRALHDYTLNTKYGILPTTSPTVKPTFKYFGIGIQGFKNLDDAQLSAPFVPSPSNMDLYSPIPFRIVPVNEDLDPLTRANYRMRVLKTIGGIDYWCYYLKLISIVDTEVKFIDTDLTTGVETELTTLDANNLTPTPTVTTAEGANATTNQISTAITANITITGEEVQEAIGVLFGGDLLRAKISEIGIYTGEDIDQVDANNITYQEAVYTHLAYHYCNLGNDFSDIDNVDNIGIRISSAKSFLI